ncbi:predicted protein [Plenodomus lingam JN3]|uniref:Predicted protein n=2 Tax=Leptosphaeria maculans TaxID=5022 RepID=E4ZK90_LEPMJ|nr:predicted protein [Plenodomus lingam JN3]CBX91685.1 predicted protein [Plenodomus lingam JN3]
MMRSFPGSRLSTTPRLSSTVPHREESSGIVREKARQGFVVVVVAVAVVEAGRSVAVMFSLTSTANLRHVTPLPRSITFAQAVGYLHNHDLLIRLDPEFASYEVLPTDPAVPQAKRYQVTDHMHALPAGLWGTTVSFLAEMTDVEDGVLWRIKAPLGLLQTTTWKLTRTERLEEDEAKGVVDEERGEWSLVEEVEIKANRLLTGTVKAKCEENWPGVHGRFVAHLKEGVAKALEGSEHVVV